MRSGCEQLRNLTVPRLYNTVEEVNEVARYWRAYNRHETAYALVGPMASEEAFKEYSRGSRVVHLATHGFFMQTECRVQGSGESDLGENPLLRSGLLLAGANLHGQDARDAGSEDGI